MPVLSVKYYSWCKGDESYWLTLPLLVLHETDIRDISVNMTSIGRIVKFGADIDTEDIKY